MGLIKYSQRTEGSLEPRRTSFFEGIGKKLAEMRNETRRINAEYEAVYRRCFEGTPEQTERRLAAWDYAHRATREHYKSY